MSNEITEEDWDTIYEALNVYYRAIESAWFMADTQTQLGLMNIKTKILQTKTKVAQK